MNINNQIKFYRGTLDVEYLIIQKTMNDDFAFMVTTGKFGEEELFEAEKAPIYISLEEMKTISNFFAD